MNKTLYILFLLLIVSNCTFKPVVKHHGVPFLEKKQKKLYVNIANKNDIKKILGIPSTTSKFDNDIWIYIERKITNSHFFGKRDLIVNNVMVLDIDDNGILSKKEFYDINDMKKIDFDSNRTDSITRRNFIYNFLSSLRQRVNDPLGVRKKKREKGTK